MAFRARVIPSGNATAVEVPAAAMRALGAATRPAVAVTINGHTWRSRVALMRGQVLIGISAANRAAAGVAEGDVVEVALKLDTEPRTVAEPADLAEALNGAPQARAAYERLPFGLKRKHVGAIDEAKGAETRARRIAKLIEALKASP